MKIELFKKEYSEEIQELLFKNKEEAFEASLTGIRSFPNISYNKPFFVAKKENKIVGFIDGTIDGRILSINHLIVFENRVGIGTKLLKHMENYARETFNEYITLVCFEDNIKGVNFYKKHNYKISGSNSFACRIGTKKYRKGLLFSKEL